MMVFRREGGTMLQLPPWELMWAGHFAGLDKNTIAGMMLGLGPKPADCPNATVHNIVSTSIVHGHPTPINLHQLSMYLSCSSYNRRRFAAITIRIDNPRCTALLFTSGKLVITGGETWYECLLASLCVSRIITSTVVNSRYLILNCELQNIVAHAEIPMKHGQKLDLEKIYSDKSIYCTYQRNQFPGLIFRGREFPVVMLCFFSGKIVLTGGKSLSDIDQGWVKLWAIIRHYVS